MGIEHFFAWLAAQFRRPNIDDLQGLDEGQLKVAKLRTEIADLRMPWGQRTFTWTTVIGLLTLFAVWSTGLLDAKKTLLQIEKVNLADEIKEFKAEKTQLLSQIGDLRKSLEAEQLVSDAIECIADNGGNVRVVQDGYAITIPVHNVTKTLFMELSSPVVVTYSEALSRSIRDLGHRVIALEIELEELSGARLSEVIASIPNAKTLSVGKFVGDADEVMRAISTCKDLRLLRIGSESIEPQHLTHLKTLSDFSSLSLRFCSQVTDDVIPVLEALPSLTELELLYTPVSKEACSKLVARGVRVRRRNGLSNE